MFDFLIDVLPREEAKSSRRSQQPTASSTTYVHQPIPQMETSQGAAVGIPGGMSLFCSLFNHLNC